MRYAWLMGLILACGPPQSGDRSDGTGGRPVSADCLDLNGNGVCDLALSADCLNGEMASTDTLRQEACILMALANRDRAHFIEESGQAPALIWDERLWQVANGHAEDMCERDYFAHETPEGLSPQDRAVALGFDFSVAENIVLGPNSPNNHFRWMDEPTCTGHRGNILNPKNRRVGVAVIRCASGQWQGMLMGVQNFHMNHTIETPSYCLEDQTHCEMPPAPISVAAEMCNNCPPNGEEMMAEWECPDD
jgi:hypothetical protein